MKPLLWFSFFLTVAFFPAGVVAAPQTDRTMELAARGTYIFTTILEGRVEISVAGGIATLTGNAHDRDLRSLATDTVGGLPGVKGVNNRMIVDTSILEYSDPWIALKLRNCLLMRAGIDAVRIHVEVSNQMATLTGAVESLEQKQLAEKYARAVSWVRSVSNELAVDTAPPGVSAAVLPTDDASISAMLKYSLRYERLITLSRAEIRTRDRVVFISGHAESEVEKALISTWALSIRGVVSVRNDMLVKNEGGTNSPYAVR